MAPNLALPGNNLNFSSRGRELRANGSTGASRNGGNSSSPGTSSSADSGSDGGSVTKSSSIQKYLINCKSIYTCIYCRTHLANHDELVSRSFQGNHGRAYLFNSLVNISCGPAVQRELNTGSHAVADIYCENCQTTLGWKYEKAFVEAQKYKEGKYIIELAHVVRENKHLELDKGHILFNQLAAPVGSRQQTKSSQNQNSPSETSVGSPSPSSSGGHSPNVASDTSSIITNNRDHNKNNKISFADELDDDLMFVFYDDFSSNNSSYSSSFSSSFHNRYRRSLYLDSTPFDWKLYATDSATDSTSLSPTLSSSPGARHNNINNDDNHKSASSPHDETQFKFEADRQDTSTTTTIETNANGHPQVGHLEQQQPPPLMKQCDQQIHSGINISSNDFRRLSLESTLDNKDSLEPSCSSRPFNQARQASNDVNSGLAAKNNFNPTISQSDNSDIDIANVNQNSDSIENHSTIYLDDEEFYDCYTDHDLIQAS